MESQMPTQIANLPTDPFWSIKLYTNGVLDEAKVAAELQDFAKVWQTLGAVIDARAEGMTGCYKLYTAEAIIEAIDQHFAPLGALAR